MKNIIHYGTRQYNHATKKSTNGREVRTQVITHTDKRTGEITTTTINHDDASRKLAARRLKAIQNNEYKRTGQDYSVEVVPTDLQAVEQRKLTLLKRRGVKRRLVNGKYIYARSEAGLNRKERNLEKSI